MNKSVITALVKTAWENNSKMEINGFVLTAVGTDKANMPVILGEFGTLTLHGAN